MPGDVLVVTSGKGGVGKTTTAVNLAIALRQHGHSVAVLDADLGMPNIAAFLGLDTETTLHDVLAGRATTAEATIAIDDGLGFVVGDRSLKGFADADPAKLNEVVADLADQYQYVLVDTGGGLTYEGVYPMELADGVLLVTSPVSAAIADTRKSKQVADRLGIPVSGLVVTHVGSEDRPESIASELDVDFLGSVPSDDAVTESAAKRQPLVAYAPESGATDAYYRIASRLSKPETAGLDPLDTAPTPTAITERNTADEADESETESDRSKAGKGSEPEAESGDESGGEDRDGSDAETGNGSKAATADGEPTAETDEESEGEQKPSAVEDVESTGSDDDSEGAESDGEGTATEAGSTGEQPEENEDNSENGQPAETETAETDDSVAEAGTDPVEPPKSSADMADESEREQDGEPGLFGRLFRWFR